MPEGHSVRRLADVFRRDFRGQVLAVSSPQGRFADGAALLDGTALLRAEAHGKQMFLGFEGGRWMRVHLGLYGKWAFGTGEPPEPRGALRVRLRGAGADGGGVWADLRGPTACEVITTAEKEEARSRLGPDPLRRDGDPEVFAARVARSRTSVAALLMDQAVVAGVGNVYRAEALFRARTDPFAPGVEVGRERALALWEDLVVLLRDGVRRGSIVTTLPADRPEGRRRGRVRREDAHYVYRRDGLPCRVCGTTVLTRELVGRNLYWCPVCQSGLPDLPPVLAEGEPVAAARVAARPASSG
ncbi:Fpg/Nei family DNA glycosylase [Pseudokineococcus marinus]|uniref:DNA-(apurinic or apyrimidinic site) lyase n=1 Tax=Pseudokineococcus marinus TaxID=351215 RepID=A0A849BXT6_9ACTN|nr:Fpg/Nei family DNA glycosylase [Pseudokineococcus marinus]NNH24246.1 Fpg/Nei family DNA glycosylase [Pseudokineococcus marinus]